MGHGADCHEGCDQKGKLPKEICNGAVSHRTLQADRPEEVASAIRKALEHIAPEQLILSRLTSTLSH